mmetsp:Transcript_15144/g.41875  ORF Transcript_15144/g.41875 Transcript_15144/m.41875 type:complete len:286 (-) Transcript_15144:2162-3019(-)
MFSSVDGCMRSMSDGSTRKHCSTLVLLNFLAISFGRTFPFGEGFVVRSASLMNRILTGMCRRIFFKASKLSGALSFSHFSSTASCSCWNSSVSINAVLYRSISCSNLKYSSRSLVWSSLFSTVASLPPISPMRLAISSTFTLASVYSISSATPIPACASCFSSFFWRFSASFNLLSRISMSPFCNLSSRAFMSRSPSAETARAASASLESTTSLPSPISVYCLEGSSPEGAVGAGAAGAVEDWISTSNRGEAVSLTSPLELSLASSLAKSSSEPPSKTAVINFSL